MKKVIAHSIYPYLFITGSWLYSQLRGIKKYDSIVVTDNIENLDIFPFENIYCINDLNDLKKFCIKVYNKIYDNYSPFVISKIREKNVSLIHSHFGNIGWKDIPAKTKMNIPQITTFYGYDISLLPKEKSWRKKYKVLFEKSDLFTVEGEYMKQSLVDLGCKEEKIQVHHLGIDLEKVRYIPRNINEDGLIKFLICGTFREKKGIPYAVEAFAKLCDSSYCKYRLTIIGDANLEKEKVVKQQIIDIIKHYKIESFVRMMGYLSYEDMLKEAENHHIFVSPSVQAFDGDNEGGAPVSIIEMSAAGMPVISTWHCDIPSVLIEGETGLLTEERNISELAERMKYLIDNPDIWNKMGEAGRRHIEENYNIKNQILIQEKIYDQFLD